MSSEIKKETPSPREVEGQTKSAIPYPKGAICILVAYLMERCVFGGLFGNSVIYFQRVLEFTAVSSSAIKAAIDGLVYISPVVGAIIADSYLGKFRTVFYMSCVYVVGASIFTASSISPLVVSLTGKQALGLVGFTIAGLSTGLMKAAYVTFGPDQFVIPDQRRLQQRYFYAFYWMVNLGILLGQIITAQLRDSVQCFQYDCYALPFITLSILMALSSVIFYSGKKLYRQVPPDSMLKNCLQCILYATGKSITNAEKPVDHWLDRAADKFDSDLISDVKKICRILLVFISWPLFWTLSYHTSTTMIFQAKRLDGYIGAYRIPPEMMSSLSSLYVLILIPLLEYFLYPLLEKRKLLTHETARMTVGMVLSVVAFIIYGILNIQVEQDILSLKNVQLNVHNADNCTASITSSWFPDKLNLEPGRSLKLSPIEIHSKNVTGDIKYSCDNNSYGLSILLLSEHETTVILFPNGPVTLPPTMDYLKDEDADSKVRITSDRKDLLEFYTLRFNTYTESYILSNGMTDFKKINPRDYIIESDNSTLGSVVVRQDGVYDVVSVGNTSKTFVVTPPSKVHLVWQTPQLVLLTTAEILFSVSCIDFAYTESASTMKSFMQSMDLLTISMGLWIYAVFTKVFFVLKIFQHRLSTEAFTYAVLMIINTVIFQWLVDNYYTNKKCANNRSKRKGKDNPVCKQPVQRVPTITITEM